MSKFVFTFMMAFGVIGCAPFQSYVEPTSSKYYIVQTAYTTTYQDRQSGYIWPLKRIDISSNFGRRNGRLHAGIDLRAPRGTAIQAAADGWVKFSGYNRDYGHMVVIDHGNGIETAYAHNSRNVVGEGQTVTQGQIVGRVGRTGNATGNHVHFEFRRDGQALNPANYLQ